VYGQSFQVVPMTAQATVGDTVTVQFRVRLDERDLLFDTVPQPLSAVPAGVRILSIDKLTRTPDRIFHGKARLAFYRAGRQPVPVFMLPFMRAVKGVQHATLASDTAFVEIGSLAPAGNPPLKDIRELKLHTGPDLVALILGAGVGVLALAWYILRRLRRSPRREQELRPAPPQAQPVTPYDQAISRLSAIERARWPAQGLTPRHYEETVDVLRSYLEAQEGLRAKERTTEELLWALPPHLTEDDSREQLRELLAEADLVKFARLWPDERAASRFLDRSRAMLQRWNSATSSVSAADAFR
jgi:hypothetical protein